MEKGKLLIKTGKSGVFANIQITDGKLLTSLGGFIPNKNHMPLDGKEIDFERINGVVVKIICEGNIIFDKASQPIKQTQQTSSSHGQKQNQGGFQRHTSQSNTTQTNRNAINKARAPYNFVSLNQTIVPVDERDIDQSKYDPKKNSDFFSPTGKAAIPGSSLRGMIRTMVEILSYSKFGFTQDDRRLYFRTFADSVRGVRDEYSRHMSSAKGEEKRMSAGLLHRKGYRSYEIIPAGKVKKVFGEEAKRYRERGKEIDRGIFTLPDGGFIVCIKNLEGTINNYHVAKDNSQKPVTWDQAEMEMDIAHYIDDINRSKSVPDLLKLVNKKYKEFDKKINREVEKFIEFVPCFYTTYKDKGKSHYAFGHNPYFRLPYQQTINALIKQNDLKDGGLDFANSIFGSVESGKENKQIAGRVFFMDAIRVSGEISDLEVAPKILSSPKPTTFQHYLEQNGKSDNDAMREHYNSNTKIRGNKLYWNFLASKWQADKQEEIKKEIHSEKSQHTLIKIANSHSIFKGRIYFENLTEKELGALLSAVILIPGSHHKIGMGKPLGLGTISIQSDVYISNSQERYGSLDSEWLEEIKPNSDVDTKKYMDSFSHYIVSKLPIGNEKESSNKTIWDLPRIKELLKMLQFFKDEKTLERFTYMDIKKETGQINPKTGKPKTDNEFKGRPILPKPTEIV